MPSFRGGEMEGIGFKIGDSITIKHERYAEESLRCRIIDKDERFLYVDYPINIRSTKSVAPTPNRYFSVFYTVSEKVYEFSATIKPYNKLTVPALAIPVPKIEEVRKIQRREFVRIKTNVDIAIHCLNNSFKPFTSVTYDISGGGAAVIIPPDICLESVNKLKVYLVLQCEKNKYDYIATEAEFIRFQRLGEIRIMSIKYHFDQQNDQEKIIQFCFYTLREKRKQGIL